MRFEPLLRSDTAALRCKDVSRLALQMTPSFEGWDEVTAVHAYLDGSFGTASESRLTEVGWGVAVIGERSDCTYCFIGWMAASAADG